MKKKSQIGLSDQLERKNKISLPQFIKFRDRLIQTVKKPKIELVGKPIAALGDHLSIKVKGFPLPIIDLFKNKLIPDSANTTTQLIYAEFQGVNGIIRTKAKYHEKTGYLSTTVPKDAINGEVTILFPLREFLGPISFVQKLCKSDEKLKEEIMKYLTDKTKIEDCQCDCKSDKKDGGHDPHDDREEYDPYRDDDRDHDRIIYLPIPLCSISLRCLGIFSSCPVCPFGAIQFDEHGCFVNTDCCLGYVYQTNKRTHPFTREEERICWSCFNPDDGEFSSKCLQRRLKKVLQINEDLCCASCDARSRTDERMVLNLIDHCPHEAITIENFSYTVDESLCTGCMECINNINCFWNTADDFVNNGIRMVSHIERG